MGKKQEGSTFAEMLGLKGDDKWIKENLATFHTQVENKSDTFAKISLLFIAKECPTIFALIEEKHEIGKAFIDHAFLFLSIGYLLCADQQDKQEQKQGET